MHLPEEGPLASSRSPVATSHAYLYRHMMAVETVSGGSSRGSSIRLLLLLIILSFPFPGTSHAQSPTVTITYPFVLGSTRCVSCGFGNFSNHAGAEFCEACPAGTYNPLNESASCIQASFDSHVFFIHICFLTLFETVPKWNLCSAHGHVQLPAMRHGQVSWIDGLPAAAHHNHQLW